MHTKISLKTIGLRFVVILFMFSLVFPIIDNVQAFATATCDGQNNSGTGVWKSSSQICAEARVYNKSSQTIPHLCSYEAWTGDNVNTNYSTYGTNNINSQKWWQKGCGATWYGQSGWNVTADNYTFPSQDMVLSYGSDAFGFTYYIVVGTVGLDTNQPVTYNLASGKNAATVFAIGNNDGFNSSGDSSWSVDLSNSYNEMTLTASWVDTTQVLYDSILYTKTKITGSTTDQTITLQGPLQTANGETCQDPPQIQYTNWQSSPPGNASQTIEDPTTGCWGDYTTPIIFSTASGETYADVSGEAAWVSPTEIAYQGQTFNAGVLPESGDNIMTLTGPISTSCPANNETMQVGDINTNYAVATTVTLNTFGTINQAGVVVSACNPLSVPNIPLVTPVTTGDICADVGGSDTSCTGQSAQAATSCPIPNSEALQWVLCPVLELGEEAVQHLSSALQSFLYVPGQLLDNDSLHNTFDDFRNLGEALLVIAGLTMVICQAAGLEIFAAYTVRKALPRIIIAAIGMALAWPILVFVITVFNDIGSFASQLIGGAFSSAPASSSSTLSSYGPGIVTLIVGAGAIAIFSASILISLLFTVVLALFVGFLVLTIRQIVIILCIIVAPLAIAASVLPNTNKLWAFWRNTLLTTLIMFPIIMAFLGAGSAMSNLFTGLGPKYQWLGVLAIVAPLFMLPLSFRMAGGLMGSVVSAVNGGFSGSFAGLKKFRRGKAGQRFGDIRSGHGWKGRNVIARKASTAAWYATNLDKVPQMRQNKEINDMAEAGRLLQESAAMKAIQSDPDSLTAVMKLANGDSDETIRGVLRANNPGLSEEAINGKLSLAKIFSRQGSSEVTAQAALLAKMADGTANDYKDSQEFIDTGVGRSGLDGLAADINGLARRDDAKRARLWGAGRSALLRGGRGDLIGESWSAGYKMLEAKRTGGDFNTRDYRVATFKQMGASAILGGKDYSSEAILRAVRDQLADSPEKGAELDPAFQELAVGLHNAQQSGVYLSPHVARLAHDIDNSGSVADGIKKAVDMVGQQYQRSAPMRPDDLKPPDTNPNPPSAQP
jgi:hypothetical protein